MPHVVRSLAATAVLIAVTATTAAAVPTITSGDPDDLWNAGQTPTYTLTAGSGTRVNWEIDDDRSTYRPNVRTPLTLRFDALPEGRHLLAVADTGTRDIVRVSFTIDRTPPAIQVAVPAAEGGVLAQGARVLADYTCADAVRCDGPVAVGQPIATATPGPADFTVTAADRAGNTAFLSRPYTVAAPAPPEPTVSAAAPPAAVVTPAPAVAPPAPVSPQAPPAVPEQIAGRPATRNARAMTPVAGARFRALRPTLRWRRHGAAVLYNVQVFRLGAGAPRKVISAFPRDPWLKLPPGRLVRGARYVWRVWPYLGRTRGFASRPIGVSFFDVRRART